MSFLDFLLYVLLIVYVLYITRAQGLWGKGTTASKARQDIRSEKYLQKKRHRRTRLLRFFAKFATLWGREPDGYKLEELKYKISRVGRFDKWVDRHYHPIEVVGFFKFLGLISLFLATFFFFTTFNPLSFVFLIGLFGLRFFNWYADIRISDEDAELEEDFPDLFLILYSRLIKDSARIAPALKDYLTALDAMSGRNDRTAIRKFVTDLRGYIDLYGDDSMAVMKIREKYRSVMIINFANLAVQALRGVDNREKLLSFKIELSQKRLTSMEKRAERMTRRGSMAVKAMYIILLQFILLSFWAKLSLSLGGIREILGF